MIRALPQPASKADAHEITRKEIDVSAFQVSQKAWIDDARKALANAAESLDEAARMSGHAIGHALGLVKATLQKLEDLK